MLSPRTGLSLRVETRAPLSLAFSRFLSLSALFVLASSCSATSSKLNVQVCAIFACRAGISSSTTSLRNSWAEQRLNAYFQFYNQDRLHQSLAYRIPEQVRIINHD